MEIQEKLSFSTNAKLGKLIGRELITNNIIAVFELIKNSYDAFAESVSIEFINFNTTGKDSELDSSRNMVVTSKDSQIIICDNGKGMSFDEVKHNWMEIGTTNKEDIINETININNRRITRVINGEKGIGRFGADKLGSKLNMISIGGEGKERSTIDIDWDLFNDHDKMLQDVSFICNVELFESKSLETGVCLRISNLRDKWICKDIINLKKQLKKMLSPFTQEQDEFNIYLKFDNYEEKIVNDSFEYANTGIDVTLDENGTMTYTIFDDVNKINRVVNVSSPIFGPLSLRILYMDSAAKRSFTRRNNASIREYGNIKLFRDNFRVLPYGEKENDWLGIDNKHAQAVFRSFGTRDIIGYVQITKEKNIALKDATNRQGLNEDTQQFEEFKTFIWKCLELLQEYVFNRIKTEAEKQGQIINNTVNEMKDDLISFRAKLPRMYDDILIPEIQKKELIDITLNSFKDIERNVNQVEQANKQLSKRLIVMEKIVGAENMLYDLIHAIKNKIATLEALITHVTIFSQKNNINFDSELSTKIVQDISKMVIAALKRTSPSRRKKEVIILSDVINSFITEKKLVYPDIDFKFESANFSRIRCNVDGLRVVLDNLMNNSIKATKDCLKKQILIYLKKETNLVKLYFEDNGIGIKDDDAPFIFNITFTRTGGSGLGLATVYQYMKEQGGDIFYLKNNTLGGALFELSFPTL